MRARQLGLVFALAPVAACAFFTQSSLVFGSASFAQSDDAVCPRLSVCTPPCPVVAGFAAGAAG